MALVEYSDSDSPSESPIPAKRRTSSLESPATKRIRIEKKSAVESGIKVALPPLPAKFRHLYSVSTRISVQDDPTLHDGRRRAIPHVVGNWPTHLYLECKLQNVGRLIGHCDWHWVGRLTSCEGTLQNQR
jgi:hypothetical protein